MKQLIPALQLVCLALIAAAAVPVALDAMASRATRADRTHRAEVLGQIAQAADAAKDPGLAAQAYADALSLSPDDPRWHAGLLAAQVQRVLADANHINVNNALSLQVALTRALSDGEPSVAHELAFGRVLHFRGQLELARARYTAALARDPQSAQGHLFLGDLQFKLGEHAAAVKTLGRALELDPKLGLARFARGQARLALEQPKDALPDLKLAVEALPKNASAHGALGKAALAEKDYALARTHLEKALSLDPPGMVGLYRELGDAWLSLRNPARAEQAYAQGWTRGHDLESLRRLARTRFSQKNWQGTFDAFNDLLSVLPDDVEAHCLMGQAAEGAGNGRMALMAYRRCAAAGSNDDRYAQLVQQAQAQEKKIAARMASQQGAHEAAKAAKGAK